MRRLLPWLLVAAAGCAPMDVELALVPAPPDGGLPARDRPCASAGDCPPGAFCDKRDCVTALGVCRPRPVACGSEPGAVCGCNGVTYWNDCLRRQNGIEGMSPGECASPVVCGTGLPACPDPDAVCGRAFATAAACTVDPEGTCWVLPPACPPPGGPGFVPCAGGACVDVCVALRSQVPHARVATCL